MKEGGRRQGGREREEAGEGRRWMGGRLCASCEQMAGQFEAGGGVSGGTERSPRLHIKTAFYLDAVIQFWLRRGKSGPHYSRFSHFSLSPFTITFLIHIVISLKRDHQETEGSLARCLQPPAGTNGSAFELQTTPLSGGAVTV